MQIGQFLFELHMILRGARDIAGAACPCATGINSGMHGAHNIGMLSHAEVIIGAPNRHLLRMLPKRGRMGEIAIVALQIGKYAIIAACAQLV